MPIMHLYKAKYIQSNLNYQNSTGLHGNVQIIKVTINHCAIEQSML